MLLSQYDMLTTPITTSHFHSQVLTLLSSYFSSSQAASPDSNGVMSTTQNTRPLAVPQLTALDTHLSPNEAMSQVIGVISPWIDICSPDPLIADVSRQILMLEVSYAAFCGIGYLLVPGPKFNHGDKHSEGLAYYARAIQDALGIGSYIQFHIWVRPTANPDLEVDEIGDLGPLARREFLPVSSVDLSLQADPFGTWDTWDLIRRTCKYHARLFVGKTRLSSFFSFSPCSMLSTKCSTLPAEATSQYGCPIQVALGTSSSAHDRCDVLPQEPKRVSGLTKSSSSPDLQIHASSERTVDPPL